MAEPTASGVSATRSFISKLWNTLTVLDRTPQSHRAHRKVIKFLALDSIIYNSTVFHRAMRTPQHSTECIKLSRLSTPIHAVDSCPDCQALFGAAVFFPILAFLTNI